MSVEQLTPRAWFEVLFAECEGWVTIFASDNAGKKKTRWSRSPDEFAEQVTSLANHDIWFGCCTRKEKLDKGSRGGDADCLEIPGIWVDVDVKGPNHKAEDLPPNDAAGIELLKSFPLRPTIVLNTGGGFQGWWLFPEPMYADDTNDFRDRWAATWVELASRKGWVIDSVFDAARILRLPGTLNHKSAPARPVTVVHFSPDRRFSLADLDEYTLDIRPKASVAPREKYEGAERPGDRFNALIDPAQLVTTHGCIFDHADRNGTRHYRAPHHANDKLTGIVVYPDGHTTIYSDTWARERGMEKDRPYDAFGLLAFLEHGGDFAAASEALEPRIEYREPSSLVAPRPTTPKAKGETDEFARIQRVALPDFTGVGLKRVRWLWEGRIPLGGLTLLAGREGEGKSTIAVDAMARVTTGNSKGELAGVPRHVVIVATEDSAEYTIKPRLLAAGADMTRVHYVQMLVEGDDSLSLPVHIPDLEAACLEHDVALIVLDPLLSRLSGNLDSHKDADVRRALEPLGGFCDRTRIAILGLIHLNKGGSTDPLQAIMASRAFTAFARSVLFAMVDPTDESRRILGLVKSNLGRTDLPTLSYSFDAIKVGEDDGDIIATRIEWGDDSTLTIGDALQIGTEEKGALTDAAEWLRDWLDHEGGSGPASQAILEASKKPVPDINKRTLQRAADKLRVTKRKVGYPPTVIWSWSETGS